MQENWLCRQQVAILELSKHCSGVLPGEAGSSKALTEQQKHRLLTVAAASVVWVKPDYLETLVTNMETELLKIERIASYLAGSPA